MRTLYFVIIPLAAFVLILLNAFYGHLLIDMPYDQDINKYSIYVHLQEGWTTNSNIIFDVTTVWSNPNMTKSENYKAGIRAADESNYNQNRLQYQNQGSYVELRHQFSDCQTSWEPILYRYAVDSVRSQIQYMQGTKLNTDPYVEIFPKIMAERTNPLPNSDAFVEFIPICTAGDAATFDFSVKTNDDDVSFDVYFVPSQLEFQNFVNNTNGDFTYYTEDGCYGIGYHSFHGTCNVANGAGLMIALEDDLNLSLTRVTVNLHENS